MSTAKRGIRKKELASVKSTPKPQKPGALAKVGDQEMCSEDENGKLIIPEAMSQKMQDALGRFRGDTVFVLLRQLCQATPFSGKLNAEALNATVPIMADIAPRDAIEVMLISQMIATHNNAMHLLAFTTPQREASRLLRAFTAQVEALRNYRRKGEQRMIIEHVTVEAGGQAVVGNVVTGGPKNEGGSKNGG
jgi:hypothetical protein